MNQTTYREARLRDIPQIMSIRFAVKENVLSDQGKVTSADCEVYLTMRGKGWVCESDNQIVAFAIADSRENNVWALFVLPEYEGRGIGKKLHDIMLDWYFGQGKTHVWLSTGFNTRAEAFYEHCGWRKAGPYGSEEIKFEMEVDNWLLLKENRS